MEEMTIWEQHTVTLSKDSKVGFGFAVSGGLDKPNPANGDAAVVVSDVIPTGPAMGRLQTRDQIVMVNGVSMENVTSLYTIQNLRNCGKTANITVKRPRTIQIPASNRPTRSASQSNILDDNGPQYKGQRGPDTTRTRRARSVTPDRNGHDLPITSGYKRLPNQDVQNKPIKTTAIERLNYIQYHPMVLFLDPHSRKDVKSMRQKYMPGSSKSSRRLYAQALKLRKNYSTLFSARIDLQPNTNMWYDVLKDKIRQQQSKPVWVSEVAMEGGAEEDLDAFNRANNSDYLSGASDYEDTDGEAFTDGEAYTDNEDLEEPLGGIAKHRSSALARSSEPASVLNHSPEPPYNLHEEEEEPEYTLPPSEVPPILHVPEPRSPRLVAGIPEEQEDVPSQRSFTDSDFSNDDVVAPQTPSDAPPKFRAPDPKDVQSKTPPLSAIEERLQQARMAEQIEPERKPSPSFIVLAHHEAMQMRRTQIRGSDSDSDENDRDEDEYDEAEDIEWGPATEL
nr:Tight junction protein 3 [Danio rerio]